MYPKFLVLLIFIKFTQPLPLSYSHYILSQNIVLYDNNNTVMTAASYTVPFTTSLPALPALCYSLNDYRTIDQFTNENIFTNITKIGVSSFIIQVVVGLSTRVQKLSINYLAIMGLPKVIIIWNSYINPIKSSSSSNATSIIIQTSFNFSQSNPKAVPFLTGFLFISSSEYAISVSIPYITSTYYQINISSVSNCAVHRVDISLLFYYPDFLSTNYSIKFDSSIFAYSQSSLNQPNNPQKISYTQFSIFILALSSFSGKTSTDTISFGWSISISTDIITVIIDSGNLINLNYIVLQISNNTANTPTAQELSQSLLLIIIIVPIVTITAFVIISYCCWIRYKKKYTKKLSKDSVTQMPSLAF